MARPQCDIPLVGSGFQGRVETLWCSCIAWKTSKNWGPKVWYPYILGTHFTCVVCCFENILSLGINHWRIYLSICLAFTMHACYPPCFSNLLCWIFIILNYGCQLYPPCVSNLVCWIFIILNYGCQLNPPCVSNLVCWIFIILYYGCHLTHQVKFR